MSAGLGKPVANNILKDPRSTNWSSYIQLYVAFFLSGLLHFASDFMFERQLVYYSFDSSSKPSPSLLKISSLISRSAYFIAEKSSTGQRRPMNLRQQWL